MGEHSPELDAARTIFRVENRVLVLFYGTIWQTMPKQNVSLKKKRAFLNSLRRLNFINVTCNVTFSEYAKIARVGSLLEANRYCY